jgi:O-methyltransferase involved in polyketide biosynthesis
MNKVSVERISDVSETMLIPLWARAVETRRTDPIVRDPGAVEIMERIDYDFSRFERSRLSQVGVAIRTMLLDNAVRDYVKRHPGAVIINLGAGLDTRSKRLADVQIRRWYDLDVPEVIELRRRLFKEDSRDCSIPESVLDGSWMDEIVSEDGTVLFIAEGLFMYFEERDLRPLFDRLVARFPNSEMLLEVLTPFCVGRSRYNDSVKKMETARPEFKWGLESGKVMESWNPFIRHLAEWSYFSFHKSRWGLLGWLAVIPALKRMFDCRIVHLRFEPARGKEGHSQQ